jgi:hypothetical protein
MSKLMSLGAVAVVISVLAGSVGFAQQAPTTRIRATIEKIDENSITIKSREGKAMTMPLAKDLRVSIANRMTLADIKENSFIGVGGVAQDDGVQRAVSIVIFPEASRGLGEGFRPWDNGANSTMTNATVSLDGGSTGSGKTITLKYKGGEKKILLTSETQVSTSTPGQMSDVKAGVAAIVTATVMGDDKFEATRITIGKDGFVPM